jgi:hypothetical protein
MKHVSHLIRSSSSGGDFRTGGEALIKQERGGENARILVEVGGQLQTERKAAGDGHGDRYRRSSQSRPSAFVPTTKV